MAQTLKEAAGTYIPPKTLNIADLNKVPVDVELKDGEGARTNGEKFQYKYISVEGQEYRVPGTVIGGIKAILKELPDTKFIKVLKEGEGKTGTKYQVIPIQN